MTKVIDREQVRKALMEAMDRVVEHVCAVAEKGAVTRLDEQFRGAVLAAAASGLAALCLRARRDGPGCAQIE